MALSTNERLKERYRYRWVKNSQSAPIKCEWCENADAVVEQTVWFADEGNRKATFHLCRQCILDSDQLDPLRDDRQVSNSDRANAATLLAWLTSPRIENCLDLILHFDLGV
jgi:hypothetical protein